MPEKYKALTRNFLLTHFRYDKKTGEWTRKKRIGHGPLPGTRADFGSSRKYRHLNIKKIKYPVGQLAVFYVTGKWPPLGVDHKDGDPDNNRWENLRPADQSQNIANARLGKNNKSGQRGVSWRKDREVWIARIMWRGKIIHLGHYKTKEAAVFARKRAQPFFFGEFARD